MECGQVKKANSICSISLQEFLEIVYRRKTGGRVRFQAGKLGHTPTHANIHNVYIQGEEYWGRCQGQV